jgi:hypothetical protein
MTFMFFAVVHIELYRLIRFKIMIVLQYPMSRNANRRESRGMD